MPSIWLFKVIYFLYRNTIVTGGAAGSKDAFF